MVGKHLSIQDLIASLTENKETAAPELKMRVNFVHENASSPRIPLDGFPAPARYLLDNLASHVLDIDNNCTVITGDPHAGKTFFIEQLAHNIDEYLNKLQGENKMLFIMLNDISMLELGNTENLIKMSQNLCNVLDAKPREICLVTESPETALYVSTVLPQHKVLLEINDDTFNGIINNATRSTSKNWRSWNIVDVNDVECTREELLYLLNESVVKRLNEKYQKKLSKRQVKSFINYTLEQMEGNEHLHSEDKEPVILTPPGIWATALRALMANYVYASHPDLFKRNGDVDLRKVMEKTLSEYHEIFGFVHNDGSSSNEDVSMDDLAAMGMPEELADLIRNSGGRMVMLGGSSDNHKEPQKTVEVLEFSDIMTLEDRLSERIMGQQDAVHRVASSFLVPAAGLSDPAKPLRSFLFLGPTGVGKTALTMELAKQVSKEEMNLIRIDMSEYQQPHEVAKLFGAPPGYMGFDKGGILTNAVAENPHSVVLFDEIEKADEKILDSLLQVLDAGHMTDGMGKTIDFTQCVVVMTSNLGAAEAAKKQLGFISHGSAAHEDHMRNAVATVMRSLEQHLRPEFINRIDDVIVFEGLTQDVARNIARREIAVLAERMLEKGYVLAEPETDVLDMLLVKADIAKYGAREIQRVVFKNIAKPLAEKIVQNSGANSFTITETNKAITITGDEEKE